MAGLVCIRRFPGWEEAAVARSALDAAGVPASLREEHYLGAEPFHRIAVGDFGLMAPRYDASASDSFLRAVATAPFANADAPCARCGGMLLRRPINWLWAIVAFFNGSAFAARRPELCCTACGMVVEQDLRPQWARMFFFALALVCLVEALGIFYLIQFVSRAN